ncbi:MAG: hypothetical protein A2V90_02535 [Gammaproteobacteria bacterium RBG_16_57_12]|nr:MAG: hypothetical protein A2V90_02535 [Gammaproteobacteria bacterium RBG_16_57_12]
MSPLSRRHFLRLLGASSATLLAGCVSAPAIISGSKNHRVVIIGGGFGGATAAKYLRLANPEAQITLVERDTFFIACTSSNQVLAGIKDFTFLSQSYSKLSFNYNIRIANHTATGIDAQARKVELSSGEKLDYDRLILTPGIDFRWEAIQGYDLAAAQNSPHAWIAGAQTLQLRKQLEAMSDGGLVIIAVPAGHYRAATAPYERAAMMAYYLKREKPRSKIIVLDSKEDFPQRDLFVQGWNKLYPGMIEWVPAGKGGRITEFNNGTVRTELASFKPEVANIIPPQQAAAIAHLAGLTDNSGWCPVNPLTFESTLQPGIHIIGDSCIADDMPKTASAANSQAKICASAVAALLDGGKAEEPAYINIGYTQLSPDYGFSAVDFYQLQNGRITRQAMGGGSTPLNASAEQLASEAYYADGWYRNIIADSFS